MIKNIQIKNFRIHKDTKINNIDSFIALVGKNDVGKTSILQALNIYLNQGTFSKTDRNVQKENIEIELTDNSGASITPRSTDYFYFTADNYQCSKIQNKTISEVFDYCKPKTYDEREKQLRKEIEKLIKIYQIVDTLDKHIRPEDRHIINKFNNNRNLMVLAIYYQHLVVQYPEVEGLDKLLSLMVTDEKCTLDITENTTFESDNNNTHFQQYLNTFDFDDLDNLDGEEESNPTIINNLINYYNKLIIKDGQIIISDNLYISQNADIKNLFENKTPSEIISQVLNIRENVNDYIIKTNETNSEWGKWVSLIKEFSKSSLDIKIAKRGSGVRRLCSMFIYAMDKFKQYSPDDNDVVFAIDEPEISIHPKQQRELINCLKEVSRLGNVQVFIATHSPQIVTQLEEKEVCVLKEENGEIKPTLPQRCIKSYFSISEINYIAFDEPSIEYHIELFGYMHNKLRINCSSVNHSIISVDNWLKGQSIDGANRWYDTRYIDTISINYPQPEYHTKAYCVRNNIDHPIKEDYSSTISNPNHVHDAFNNNRDYDKIEIIETSIKEMRKVIQNNSTIFT